MRKALHLTARSKGPEGYAGPNLDQLTFTGDYLLVALGAELAPDTTPGLAQGRRSRVENLRLPTCRSTTTRAKLSGVLSEVRNDLDYGCHWKCRTRSRESAGIRGQAGRVSPVVAVEPLPTRPASPPEKSTYSRSCPMPTAIAASLIAASSPWRRLGLKSLKSATPSKIYSSGYHWGQPAHPHRLHRRRPPPPGRGARGLARRDNQAVRACRRP